MFRVDRFEIMVRPNASWGRIGSYKINDAEVFGFR